MKGTNMAESLAASITGQPMPMNTGTNGKLPETDDQGNLKRENKIVENAREESQAVSQPR